MDKETINNLLCRFLEIYYTTLKNPLFKSIKKDILVCIGQLGGIERLLKLFEEEKEDIYGIINAILELRNKTAIPMLEKLFDTEKNSLVRFGI